MSKKFKILEVPTRVSGNWQFGSPLNLLPSALEFGKWVTLIRKAFKNLCCVYKTARLTIRKQHLYF